ncbi:MAG: glycosyltransferase family 4 protein [Actinobacteria bacterium]|nr:glycosyltransferase family 4 protein [Actinomycetota bacterium]
MRIAYFSPLNPIKTGVSDYSEELLEYLAGYGDVDIFVDNYEPSTKWLHECFNIYDHSKIYENHGSNNYDIHLYHMGNNENHSNIYRVLMDFPGVVVLHEPMLHHFVFSQTVGNNRLGEYLRELDYCYKSQRSEIVKTTLEDRDENSWYDYPMINRIVDSSMGIIVHSEFARRIVLEINPRAHVRKIMHHSAPPRPDQMRSPELLRDIFDVKPDEFLIGSFGYITASKRIDVLLEAVARLKKDGHRVKLLLVGKRFAGCEPLRWIEELGLQEEVIVTGFVDTRTFREYLTIPDVFVALRYPSAGETSGSVIKTMGAGKPVILSDSYAFSEFPDDCCLKITPGGDEAEKLYERLAYLIDNRDERLEIGNNARRYIQTHHDIQNSARQYIEFSADVLNSNGL